MTTPIEGLLPHRGPMVLLDAVEAAGDGRCTARWTVPAACPWLRDGALAPAALVEMAAQTAAAGFGAEAVAAGATPAVGHLGAVAGFAVRDVVRAGDVLSCTAVVTARFERLFRIAARIERRGGDPGSAGLVAEGELTVSVRS